MNISRRKFLRGTGVLFGLPWLESVQAFGAASPRPHEAPRRLAVCFMGNGVNPAHWGASSGLDGLRLHKSLTPLEPLKQHLNVFQGLWNPASIESEGTHCSKMNVLSGLRVKKTTSEVEVGVSMDQVIAAHAAKATPVPSIVLGTERPKYATSFGFTSLYSAHISWSSPTTPAPKEIFPQQAFDQLFDDGSKRVRNKSILDLVRADARSLRPKLSYRDGQKLDEYLDSVRELEQRIARAEKSSAAPAVNPGWAPKSTVLNLQRPATGLPVQAEEHLRLMFDILLHAFQMDRTRVATFMLNNDQSDMRFASLGGVSEGMHDLSHHGGDIARLARYQRVNELQVKLWAEFLAKMHAVNEGERSLLQNSMVLLTSSLMDGNVHDSTQLPVVLAGGGGGTIRGGRHFDLGKDTNRILCRLHLALMDRMGVRVERFGDAENALNI